MMPDFPQRPPAARLHERYPRTSALVVGLVVGLLALGLFALIAASAVSERSLYQLDRTADAYLRQHLPPTPAGEHVFNAISLAGDDRALVELAIAAALILYMSGRRCLALGVLMAGLGAGQMDELLKPLFHQPRPPIPGMPFHQSLYGFPSSHSLRAVIGWGLLAYAIVLIPWRRRRLRLPVLGILALAVLLIGFSRMYLHAHYLSQVLGGFTVGAVWLALCLAALEALRRRPPGQPLQEGAREGPAV